MLQTNLSFLIFSIAWWGGTHKNSFTTGRKVATFCSLILFCAAGSVSLQRPSRANVRYSWSFIYCSLWCAPLSTLNTTAITSFRSDNCDSSVPSHYENTYSNCNENVHSTCTSTTPSCCWEENNIMMFWSDFQKMLNWLWFKPPCQT